MKNKLNEAFDNIDDKYIAQAQNPPKNRRALKIALIAAALALIIAAVPVISVMSRREATSSAEQGGSAPAQTSDQNGSGDKKSSFTGSTGDYSGAKYVSLADLSAEAVNAVKKEYKNRIVEYCEHGEKLATFFDTLYENLLDGDKSGVVSPVSIYMALSLLAECTGGNSRKEILDVIGVENIEQLREQSKMIWAFNSCDDEHGKSILANSVWIDGELPVKDQCAEYLKNDHFASAFNGDFDDPAYINAMKQWLSDMTNGLLDNCINDLEIPPETAAVLASTLYYKARWYYEYYKTENGKFEGADCVFNVKTDEGGLIYKGDGFTAYADQLSDGNTMWFFLPNEGKTAADVLSSGVISYINGPDKNCKQYDVTVRMPDFDVDYNENIKDEIAKLGIKECMDINKADFSAMTENNLCVGDIIHAARFKADKEGVEGAAYTIMDLCGSAMPTWKQKYDFTLDRPFVFVVENSGTPLFVGCVNEVN